MSRPASVPRPGPRRLATTAATASTWCLIAGLLAVLLLVCGRPQTPEPDVLQPEVLQPEVLQPEVLQPEVLRPDRPAGQASGPPPIMATPVPGWSGAYAWLAGWADAPPEARLAPLKRRLPTPEGMVREAVAPGSFAAWLRSLPIRLDRTWVETSSGHRVLAPAAAVIALDLGRGDLQQCADCLIRLHAEYLWSSGLAARAGYHFTSGHLSTWQAWQQGQRLDVRGSIVRTRPGAPRPADHDSYRQWLQQLFIYAGTLSLASDSVAVPLDEPLRAGDLLVEPGSPGHTVVVLDVATMAAAAPEGAADTRRWGLIGQGYTPAQDMHVLRDPYSDAIDAVWFPLPRTRDQALDVPGWRPFPRTTARRFNLGAQAR